ncbi:alpha/beta hydrolase [Aureimonas endophytica]|uniref:Alpha/beta hydrolase n=1 Tax=Aureimonas endophytica TaxID=2027858 RepID=A0A917E180_9HYPH|nr:alpha/beta hydrolase [Aureimonas endophytica]GGD91032.1 alpha/beta hydrolase [Aureimonas endophytica]
MRVSQADILIVPGYKGAGPEHWQTRWERRLSTARRVEQAEWSKPVREDWVKAVAEAVNASTRPVVIVAHSLGVATTVLAVPHFRHHVAGAFLVAPPDVANPKLRPKHLMTFGPYPREPLPFPSFVIASQNDPFCDYAVAEDIAHAWGALILDAGNSGHIDAESGHGPWPEGLLTFGKFVSRLSTDPLPRPDLTT